MRVCREDRARSAPAARRRVFSVCARWFDRLRVQRATAMLQAKLGQRAQNETERASWTRFRQRAEGGATRVRSRAPATAARLRSMKRRAPVARPRACLPQLRDSRAADVAA